jgi:PASTA domain/Putative Ig domain
MPNVNVPSLVGLTQSAAEEALKNAGLVVGNVTKAQNDSVPSGSVSAANPAAATLVSQGSAVDLEVSSGPGIISVPDVIGLTRAAATEELTKYGFVVGAVKTRHSHNVPSDGVHDTIPAAGAPATRGSSVTLVISSGPATNWTQSIPPVLFAALGFMVISLIGYIILAEKGHAFLDKLAVNEVARGLITFVVAISTVGIAIILAISTVLGSDSADDDKRFDRGKQVLSILIGVLGTIVGFYFGSAPTPIPPATKPAITTTMLPDGTTNRPYPSTTLRTTGLKVPLTWSVNPALPPALMLDAESGTISGTPTAALQKMQFEFTVKDSAVPVASLTANIQLEIK